MQKQIFADNLPCKAKAVPEDLPKFQEEVNLEYKNKLDSSQKNHRIKGHDWNHFHPNSNAIFSGAITILMFGTMVLITLNLLFESPRVTLQAPLQNPNTNIMFQPKEKDERILLDTGVTESNVPLPDTYVPKWNPVELPHLQIDSIKQGITTTPQTTFSQFAESWQTTDVSAGLRAFRIQT